MTTNASRRLTHRRGIRLALALMLTTSAAGIVAYQPVAAQSESEYVRAFGFSDYTYCDAKLVGQLWDMSPYEGKIQIGMKIVGGYDDNLVSILQMSRDRGNSCEWADTGLSYDDAEVLAGVWGGEPWEAKARAARMFTLGRSGEVTGYLMEEGGEEDETPFGDALDRFWNSGYSYCDAKMIGELYGTDAYQGKIEIGNKIANGLVANIPLVLNESRQRGARCNWTDLPYGYDDAVLLGQAWGMRYDEAKVAAEELATWGRTDVIAAALGHEGH
ncbi:MAG: hypothetical protein GW855_05275 [Erythrobacter sp.]|nr:hypothetical protein [Erythrobacter sp.]NCQ65041.1 hypothetical protein [Alphaproteobacteria bacterium]